MSVTTTFQDYMAGWDLARSVIKDCGLKAADSLLVNVVAKPGDTQDSLIMGILECAKTAIAICDIPMKSVDLFA